MKQSQGVAAPTTVRKGQERGTMLGMHVLKAHVENGLIIADEPVNLPDGTLLRVVPVDELDDEMSAEEHAELEQAIEEGAEDFERGDHEDAREFAARLVAKP